MITSYIYATYVPERMQFARFAVKGYRNYRITVTSRTESSHAQLKVLLRNRFSDLFQLHTCIWELSLRRRQAYSIRFEKEITTRQTQWLNKPVFTNLVQKVGWKAMNKIEEQLELAKDFLSGKKAFKACTGEFTQQWGLPCYHRIILPMQRGQSLELEDLDCHWWLKAITVCLSTPWN